MTQRNFRGPYQPSLMAEGFSVAGQSMPKLTIYYGSMLVLWGVAVSILSNSGSVTSLFPSFLGLGVLVPGILAQNNPEKKKFWMHIAVVFGLLCALGGTRFFMVMSDGIDYASGSMLMLLITGSIYTYFCVQSFIYARKNAEASINSD